MSSGLNLVGAEGRRGQAFIDTLMIFLVASVLLATLHLYIGTQSRDLQALRYESSLHQAVLMSVSQKYLELGIARGRAKDLIVEDVCDNSIDISQKIKSSLDPVLRVVNTKKHRHYILYIHYNKIGGGTGEYLRIFDLYPQVCIDDVVVSRLYLNGQCADGSKVQIMFIYGSWPEWKSVKETC